MKYIDKPIKIVQNDDGALVKENIRKKQNYNKKNLKSYVQCVEEYEKKSKQKSKKKIKKQKTILTRDLNPFMDMSRRKNRAKTSCPFAKKLGKK
jgi:hypothetical protein